ncbi:hypothetical protein BKA67DRAFT_528325 [Truncatella angustata]|uniref:Uncharacterized protein n=1 Tax=Truncatella angustata TaxID=152316 RepID=A0A9P8U7Y4_9PEZI|nr:uncharacterized protein BKA67DRAFT_528325 [Truncatella angustata]KAH6640069.1 hypothetical protein BKA67DRAFT_528325 [Truncatella angustata]
MGLSDTPPAHVPEWVVPLSTTFLGLGVVFWDLTYILITRRSLRTRSYGMPILGLMTNVSWEMVYGFYVAETALEQSGFILWLLLDLGLVYTTIRFAPDDWAATSPKIGRNISWVLGSMLLFGCWGHYAFVSWWLSAPGIGFGDKTGKWWRGKEGYDQTELAYWSAGVAQMVLSVASVAMLLIREHSGGTSYKIWFCRFFGSLSGMGFCNGVLWWYWPEAHGYWVSPLGIFICGCSLAADTVYPFLLHSVRKHEVQLPDGRLVRGDERKQAERKSQ